MARIARGLFLLIASLGIVGFATLPLVIPRGGGLAHLSSHSQTADAYDPWIQDGYPVPMSPEEAGIPPEDPEYDGSLKGDYAGYGGSLKDDAYGYYDAYDTGADAYYDEPYGMYYEDTWYEEPSYGSAAGSYVAAGLAQVPLVLANVLAPRTATYHTYTTTYVPQTQQTYTYAVPQTQYVQQQPVQYQQSGTIQALTGAYTPRPQIATTQQVVDINRPIESQQIATIQQPVQGQQVVNGQIAQITAGGSQIMVAQPVAVPAETAHASFFAVPQQTQQVRTISADTGSSRIGIAQAPSGGSVHPVCTIRAKPSTIAAGATTSISWSAANADSATLDPIGPVALVGSSTVKLATTTTFTLRLDGAAGSESCSVKVSIDQSLCLPGCPPGYVCTPATGTTAPTPKRSGFWSWFGF